MDEIEQFDLWVNSVSSNRDEDHKLFRITPRLASHILNRYNTNNIRAIYRKAIDQYSRDIENDAWTYNGDTLKFGPNGILQDGQHRLTAISMNDVTVACLCVRGLPEEAVFTMDRNQPRSLGLLLSLAPGYEKHASHIAKACRVIEVHFLGNATKPTVGSIIDLIEKYDLYEPLIACCEVLAGCRRYSQAPLLATIVLAHKIDSAKAIQFATQVRYPERENISVRSPAGRLREALQHRQNGYHGEVSMVQASCAAVMCHLSGKKQVGRLGDYQKAFQFIQQHGLVVR